MVEAANSGNIENGKTATATPKREKRKDDDTHTLKAILEFAKQQEEIIEVS